MKSKLICVTTFHYVNAMLESMKVLRYFHSKVSIVAYRSSVVYRQDGLYFINEVVIDLSPAGQLRVPQSVA